MRVKNLGSRPAPASLLQLFGSVMRGPGPSITIERRKIPYWQDRGWRRNGNIYEGTYQTPYEAFQGWIEQERSGRGNFYLYRPSDAIRRHSHFTCFQHRGNDWYLVHMAKEPRDVGSGIITIERLITEAYEQ